MTVKVRIAPSPTGNLHIGTARTALFNWLFARRHGGQFILRIEDTDLERSSKEYEANIIEGLSWLGLDWDNEQVYRQTERLDIYRSYLQRLLDSNAAHWREYSAEEKTAMEKEGRLARDKVIVLSEPADGNREIAFDDIIRGRVAVQSRHVGQVVLAKDLETPLFNFANVVDDIDMKITHVIRGEDHISNTAKQLLIFEALSEPPPQFAHLPLILGDDRSKMSKRHGATSIADYQTDYLSDALVSFLGQLGYTYDRELLGKKEMAEQFDLKRVHASGAVFDVQKLNWTNAQFIKRLPAQTFKLAIGMPELPDSAVPIMTERLERLGDISQFEYLWSRSDYDSALLLWKDDDVLRARAALQKCAALVREHGLTQERLDALALSDFEGKKGSVYWPLRISLSGRQNSAGPLDIARVIGDAETTARIENALTKII